MQPYYDSGFDPEGNLQAAFQERVGWGYYDQGWNHYRDGFQSRPANWRINTPMKWLFLERVARLTGSPVPPGPDYTDAEAPIVNLIRLKPDQLLMAGPGSRQWSRTGIRAGRSSGSSFSWTASRTTIAGAPRGGTRRAWRPANRFCESRASRCAGRASPKSAPYSRFRSCGRPLRRHSRNIVGDKRQAKPPAPRRAKYFKQSGG